MPKAFRIRIYSGYLTSTTEIKTDAEHNELLGRADDVSYQINLENMEAVTNVTVKHYVSNDGGKYFLLQGTPINNGAVSGTTDQVLGSTSGVNGDQAYATITLASGGVPKAYAELWACGRTS